MSNEMLLLYHIAHMAKHLINGGCGIKPFLDLEVLLEKLSFDREKLNFLLKKAGLSKLFDVACKLCGVWFNGNESTEALELLSNYILSGGVYGTYENSAQISAAKGVGKLKSFSKLMFLPKENLAVLYPKLKKVPYLYPFYQIKRWFRIFDRHDRNKLRAMTAARNDVSEKGADSGRRLLSDLELDS